MEKIDLDSLTLEFICAEPRCLNDAGMGSGCGCDICMDEDHEFGQVHWCYLHYAEHLAKHARTGPVELFETQGIGTKIIRPWMKTGRYCVECRSEEIVRENEKGEMLCPRHAGLVPHCEVCARDPEFHAGMSETN